MVWPVQSTKQNLVLPSYKRCSAKTSRLRRFAIFIWRFDELLPLTLRLQKDHWESSAYWQLPMLTRRPSHSPSIKARGMIRQAPKQSGTVERNQVLTRGSAQSSWRSLLMASLTSSLSSSFEEKVWGFHRQKRRNMTACWGQVPGKCLVWWKHDELLGFQHVETTSCSWSTKAKAVDSWCSQSSEDPRSNKQAEKGMQDRSGASSSRLYKSRPATWCGFQCWVQRGHRSTPDWAHA